MATLTIRNDIPRVDTDGRILDCHDGNLEFHAGRYYLYGTRYGDTHGYTTHNRYVCYSSSDLKTWRYHGELIPGLAPRIYYRPYVKFNPRSGAFVLWFNWYQEWRGTTNWAAGDGPTPGHYGIAVADRPEGPFRIVTLEAQITHPVGVGDHNLFVDDDGTGYLIYASPKRRFDTLVERLAPDFRASTGACSAVLASGVEAPCLFRRGILYYVLLGRTCCFCPQGSGSMVFRSAAPLGPYEYRGNINRHAPRPTADDAGDPGDIIIPAQQTHVARIATATGDALLWLADRWESAPDGVKGHDLQYWSPPLAFTPDGDILPIRHVDQWSFEA